MKRIQVFLVIFICGCATQDPSLKDCDSEVCMDVEVMTDSILLPDSGATPDDSSGEAQVVFPDEDNDSYTTETDCNDDDGNIYPGANEVCNGKDDDCDGKIDNNLVDTGDACGSSVGECKQGTLKCVNAKLICDGTDLVSPQNELCDGKDNDCDGQTDEDFKNLGTGKNLEDPCTSGVGKCAKAGWLQCNGTATKLVCSAVAEKPGIEGPPGNITCYDGKDNDCDGLSDLLDPNCISCSKDSDCNDLNNCTSDSCVGGVCQNINMADGTFCSDGLYCNGIETCGSGKCGAGPNVLCDDNDACTTDTCSESLNKCVFTVMTPGSSEGAPGSAACLDGKDNDCDGNMDLNDSDCVECQKDVECTDKGLCVNRVCNSKKVCVYSDKADGISCSDGKYCNGVETCKSGICQIGIAIKCDDNNVCTNDKCDETLKCTHTAVSDCKSCMSASECNDGNACTTDSCPSGQCVNTKLADGMICNDGAYCTKTDTCFNGTCVGTLRDCSSYSNQCKTGYCDESSDSCKTQSKADGTSCSDGLYCNGYESCKSGICSSGTSVTCATTDSCKVSSCDETQDQCILTNNPNPGAENWALSGTCADGKDNDCDGLKDYADSDCRQCQYNSDCDDGKYCTQDTCNIATWQCQNTVLAGSTCDDGKWCTEQDKCTSTGTCVGTSRDCSSSDDQCNTGTCDEASQTCKLSYKPSMTLCDDGKYCTIGDYCVYGQCVSGGARSCTSGYCDESLDVCGYSGSGLGCADGQREGFVDQNTFPLIAGCSGAWRIQGLSNVRSSYGCSGAGDDSNDQNIRNGYNCRSADLCSVGWHICNDEYDTSQHLPYGKTCADGMNGANMFFATLQSSQSDGKCSVSGSNDIFGCGNIGDPPAVGYCGKLNRFSSEDCQAIAIIPNTSTLVWDCDALGDNQNEKDIVEKIRTELGGVLCCKD